MCESKCEKCNADIILEFDEENNPIYVCSYCGMILEEDGEIYYGV